MSKMRRLRVVHVSRGLDVGGQERLLIDFARRIDRRRFDLHFVSLTTRGSLASKISDLGWPVTALNQPEGLRPRTIWNLIRFFRRQRCDVLHTHDDKPLVYAAPAARLAGVPRTIHSHHHGPVDYIQRRQLFLLRCVAVLPDRFVCVSRDSMRYLASQGVGTRRLLTVHNGIDLDIFPYRTPDPSGPVVCVARLSPEKDIANLLHAVAAIRPIVPDFRLEIAGDGPLRDELRRLADTLRLTHAVRFLGEVNDVPALLARARLFVLPSRTEGISLTILEAMARGLPVVATRVGGNPEVVVEGETGLLVPPRDPQALAGALARLWSNLETVHAFGAAGRRRVELHFSVRRMIDRYERLYEGDD